MNRQFKLTGIGVQEWLAYVYEGGEQRIAEECTYIAHDFVGWVSYRFSLSPDQIDFLIALGELVHESYSTDIQNTLQLRGPISLDKEEAPAHSGNIQNAKAQNPKVVWKEKQNETKEKSESVRSQNSQAFTQKARLHFRISYPDIDAD
ncbi:hypothetical protein ORI89_02775 [Sphingobacterium sp. UT-1RO-CII-1]|uniref:hypothetical protein n=1 Tax=Sphingobacterium sp. UT-1RO-CII-1 TaxID=2995225 RepID=UPI00227CF88C|nr:hypothetical protein [Sphingobacterium sp. UT-1RO-CII-1]MCY4778559.1 hypothetical protein [Sphingobacterium sp. UT-1RO-CII-1]